MPSQALTLAGASASYDGFECYRWERGDERVRFDVYNFGGGCNIDWQASATPHGSSKLDLVLSNPSCEVYRCGSCLYDAAFEVDTEKTPLADDAKAQLIVANCSGERGTLGSWQLQPGDGAEGIRCNYTAGLAWHDRRVGRCGTLHATCRNAGLCNSGTPSTADPCDEGLACTEVGDLQSMCLKKCTTSDDCPLQDVLECRDEVCQLKQNP